MFLTSPSHPLADASYLVKIDILADADAHRALDSLGWSDFQRIPGWLAESLSEAQADVASGPPNGVKRFVCMQAFDRRTNLNDVARVLQGFTRAVFAPETGYANFKVRTYKLFGSVGVGI